MTDIKTKKEFDEMMKSLRETYELNKDEIVLRPFDKSFGIDDEGE